MSKKRAATASPGKNAMGGNANSRMVAARRAEAAAATECRASPSRGSARRRLDRRARGNWRAGRGEGRLYSGGSDHLDAYAGPIVSNGGAITVTGGGSVLGGPDGVDAIVCSITDPQPNQQAGGDRSAADGRAMPSDQRRARRRSAGGAGGAGVSNASTITTLTNSGAINGGSGGGGGSRSAARAARACRTPARSRR